jgi:hypothetical protein
MTYFILVNQKVRHNAIEAVKNAPEGYAVTVKPKTRTLDQNSRLWALLNDVSTQVLWRGEKLSNEDWKNLFSASLKKQKLVQGLDGGLVVLGQSTSKMTVAELGDLMTIIEAFGANHGVKFGDDSRGNGRPHRSNG